MGLLREVKKITVKRVSGERYPEVESCELGEADIERRCKENLEDEEEWDDLPF